MSILDIVILVILIPAIIRGLSKGLIEQVVAFASIFISAILAFLFADKVGDYLNQWVTVDHNVLWILSFVIIVIISVALFNLSAKLISKIVSAVNLGWINRTLGLVFAVLNTVLVIGLLLMWFTNLNASTFHLSTGFMDESVLYGWIKKFTDFVFPFLQNLFDKFSHVNFQQ